MSTTATTIAITSATNAAAAAAHARSACMSYVRGYEHERATVTEMREYAGCVDRLHPAPMESGDMMAWKFVIVVLLISMVAGAVHEWHDPFAEPFEAIFFGGIMGLGVGAVGVAVLAGIWFGVRFLAA